MSDGKIYTCLNSTGCIMRKTEEIDSDRFPGKVEYNEKCSAVEIWLG